MNILRKVYKSSQKILYCEKEVVTIAVVINDHKRGQILLIQPHQFLSAQLLFIVSTFMYAHIIIANIFHFFITQV